MPRARHVVARGVSLDEASEDAHIHLSVVARVPGVAVRAFVRVTHFFKRNDPCVGDWCEESFDDPCVGDWCEGALDDPCVGDWCPEGFGAKKADPCVGDWCPESFVE